MSFDTVLAEHMVSKKGKVALALEALSEKDRAAANKALSNGSIPPITIARTLTKMTGVAVSNNHVYSYRVKRGLTS